MPSLILAAAVLPSLQMGGAGLTRRNFHCHVCLRCAVCDGCRHRCWNLIAALAAMGMAVGIVAVLPGGQETLQKAELDVAVPGCHA